MVEIKKFIDKSEASLDRPFLMGGIERAIPKPDFARIDLKKLETSAQYNHILYSDISRFYSTIYTHAIPWALYGKNWSKGNMFTAAFKASLGNQLDVKVRKGASNQTIGIPIGPDTSRIISEIIAIAIEERYRELSGNSLDSVFRYVDDWFIGFNTAMESEMALSHLSRACTEFELELNIEKTRIVDAQNPAFSIWPEQLTKLSKISSSGRSQARDIQHYFEMAFFLANEVKDASVLDYALKISRSFSISSENYVLYESFVLRAARASEVVLPVAAQILINYQKRGAAVNQGRVQKLISDTLAKAMPHGYTSEVAWALFLAREMSISIDIGLAEGLSQIDNSPCILICLDLLARGLFPASIDFTLWRSLMSRDSLENSNWLVAYEADLKGWMPHSTFPSHVDAHPWFRVLKHQGISFYDEARTVPSFEASSRLQITRLRRRSSFARALFGAGFAFSGFYSSADYPP